MGAAWLLPGWAALLEPTLQALKELGVPARAAPLTSMHFSIDCLCLTELQLDTLLWEASGGQAVSSAPPPHPKTGQESQPHSPIRTVTALDGRSLRPHPALICRKPWPPNPMRSQGSLMALLSSAQGHAVLLVSAVWTVPGGHWASRGPCCAIYKRQKIKPRGGGCRELGQFVGLSSPGLCTFRGRLPASPAGCPSACLSLRGLLLALGVTQKGPLDLPLGLSSVWGAPGKGTPPSKTC